MTWLFYLQFALPRERIQKRLLPLGLSREPKNNSRSLPQIGQTFGTNPRGYKAHKFVPQTAVFEPR